MVELTQRTFTAEIAKPGLQVVDFWAPWCGPCRAMAPQMERAASMRPDYRFAKVNVDEEQALAQQFDVRGIPTLAVFVDGELVGTTAGLVQAKQLVKALDDVAAAKSKTQ
jgi:thioredoxin